MLFEYLHCIGHESHAAYHQESVVKPSNWYVVEQFFQSHFIAFTSAFVVVGCTSFSFQDRFFH